MAGTPLGGDAGRSASRSCKDGPTSAPVDEAPACANDPAVVGDVVGVVCGEGRRDRAPATPAAVVAATIAVIAVVAVVGDKVDADAEDVAGRPECPGEPARPSSFFVSLCAFDPSADDEDDDEDDGDGDDVDNDDEEDAGTRSRALPAPVPVPAPIPGGPIEDGL